MKRKIIVSLLLTALIFGGCGMYKSIMNLSKLKFKLDSVNNFKISGIAVNGKSQLSDFNPLDLVKLTSQVAQGNLPVSFTLNVLAKNPNAESIGTTSTDIKIVSFPWKLFIDDKETISGNISSPVIVPGGNKTSVIPLNIGMNLMEFFSNSNLESLVNLALKLGGGKGATSHIKLVARPVLDTPVGNITYPGELTIVDYTYK